jgi:adenosylmethionine-8-amino-7-oxononanoate aminotransferase
MRKNLSHADGPELTNWLQLDLDHLWHPYTQMRGYENVATAIVKAHATRVWDQSGKEYLDGMSGLWNVNLGHSRPEIVDAIVRQLNELDYFPLNGFSHLPAAKLAAALAGVAPGELCRVFFCTGGAEAMETALKISRQYWLLRREPNRRKVISVDGGWHGGTLGALSAAGITEERKAFGRLLDDFYRAPAPFSDGALESFRALLMELGPETVSAVVVEPIQGAGGIRVPPDGYLQSLRALTTEFGCHLILDEVATGFGRTGTMFAAEQWGIQPDFLLCSKAITNGCIPLGAVLTTDSIYEAFLGETPEHEFTHGYTFGGHPVACAAALATVQILRGTQVLSTSRQRAGDLLAMLRDGLASCDVVADVRGRGMMLGVEISAGKRDGESSSVARAICMEARKRGLIVRSIGAVIPVMPPLVLQTSEVDELCDKLVSAVRFAQSNAIEETGATYS